jgi:Flp pilus assembly pilin Flp
VESLSELKREDVVMLNLLKSFIREDEGLEMVEWAIVAALITTAAAVTMGLIGTQVNAQFLTILGNITP